MTKLIVNCIGGLGNQMTQYAFYKELEYLGYDVKLYTGGFKNYTLHNGYELDKIFDIKPKYAFDTDVDKFFTFFHKIKRKFGLSKNIITQEYFNYSHAYLKYNQDSFVTGYWQSEKYFADVFADIRRDFIFPLLSGANQEMAQQIIENNSISVHVRRGDYVGHELYDGICDIDYYNRAMLQIKQYIKNPMFFVFSNDLSWCRENLNIENAIYVDINDGKNGYRDMHLMSLCKHNILANSSFSWWAGWLNSNPDKIIMVPKKFFNSNIYDERDLYPNEWIKI